MTNVSRIHTIDVLRGFALLGIFITHIYSINMGVDHGYSNKINSLINIVYINIFFGKFYTIFSFLFGLSFYIQLQNATIRGNKFVGRYVFRLFILFLIGALHFLLYAGDILQLYSVLGLMLVLCRKFTNKTILALSVIFLLLSIVIPILNLTSGMITENSFIYPFIGGKFATKYNWYLITEGQLFVVGSFFFLGFYAGKMNFFKTINLPAFKKTLFYTFSLATIVTGGLAFIYFSGARKSHSIIDLDIVITILTRFQQVFLSFFYLSTIVLICELKKGKLDFFISIGKIGLTIYILQSVVIYYLNSIFLNQGIMVALATGILVFVLLIFLSKLWLSQFKHGPIEWLWRSLTNLQLPSFSSKSAVNEGHLGNQPK